MRSILIHCLCMLAAQAQASLLRVDSLEHLLLFHNTVFSPIQGRSLFKFQGGGGVKFVVVISIAICLLEVCKIIRFRCFIVTIFIVLILIKRND